MSDQPRADAIAAHPVKPKLMPAGQEWYCVTCNRTVHRHGESWRHNPEPKR